MPLLRGRRRDVRVFINYRKEDAAGQAGRLYDSLAARYGEDRIFIDTDTIGPGEDWRDALAAAVGRCDVLVAVIGRTWLTVTDADGVRRIEGPADWVRVEIESALEQGVRVIPALVDGAKPPKSDELPESLEPLAHRQAMTLGSSAGQWRFDVGRLVGVIEKPGTPRSRLRSRRARLAALGVAAVGATVAVVIALLTLLPGGGSLGKPGDVAFTRNDGINRMNADGTHVRRLYETGRTISSPAWSPDAKHIAFVMDGEIWLLGSGGGPKQLTDDPALGPASPAWSPDGRQIAFAAGGPSSEGKSGIAVVGVKGGDVRFLLQDNEFDGSPSWSPDGTQIAFSTARDPLAAERTTTLFLLRSIYELRLSDGAIAPLVYPSALATPSGGVRVDQPDWAPDGKSIVFMSAIGTGCVGGCLDVYTVATHALHRIAVPPSSAATLFSGYTQPRYVDSSTVEFSYQSQLWKVRTTGGLPEQVGAETDVFGPTVARPERR